MAGASRKTKAEPRTAAQTVALVANPGSGSSDPELTAMQLRSFGADVEYFEIEEAAEAARAGADRVVVAGGDGSIAVVAAAAGEAGVPLAVVPAGTANDFARRLGLPDELSAACRLAVRGTRLRSLELGWLHPLGEEGIAPSPADRRPRARRGRFARAKPHPFVNVASTGLPAPAAERAHNWKRYVGPLAYGLGAVAAGLTARPLPCLVDCGGRELLAGEAWQVTVAASGAFGAGAAVEEADPEDGRLEVVAIEAGPRLGLVSLAYRLRSGAITGHPRAFHASCVTAEVRVPADTSFNVDGDLVTCGSARFSAARDAYQLVVG